MKQAVFLDRDGVINDNSNPVNKPEDLKLYPWTVNSIKQLKEAGFLVMVVTNQGGLELGYFSKADLKRVHQHLVNLLQTGGTNIDDLAYCPHFDQQCECRKPQPGLILNLAKKHQVDLAQSWMIGDRQTDIEAGISAGCRTIKIGTPTPRADYNCLNLQEAVNYILKTSKTTVHFR